LNLHTGALRTYWSGNHTPTLAFGAPLLVLDMSEHAYQMDYGAAAAKYIDAFMRERRLARSEPPFRADSEAGLPLHTASQVDRQAS